MNLVFITGPVRSGSTLIEKLLHNHDNIAVGSQPFPYLYFKAKNKFYSTKHIEDREPLGHLFLERSYKLKEFYSFLESCFFTDDDIKEIFQGMTTYSGQHMPELLQFSKQIRITPDRFYNLYVQLLSILSDFFRKDNLSYIGTKESFCEEYIPFLLAKRNKVIVIIRDPRDIVASLNYGQGAKYAGGIRPVIYVIRQWRKSVGFCLQYRTDSNFAFIKYEDLVSKPMSILNKLTEFLELPPFQRGIFSKGIFNYNGQVWKGNSSFNCYTSISPDSIGNFKQILPENCVRFIEAICYPELSLLNYTFSYQTGGPDVEAIRDFKEPLEITHKLFVGKDNDESTYIQEEILRLKHLQSYLVENSQRLWFIFPNAYHAMKDTLDKPIDNVESKYHYKYLFNK